MLRSLYTSADIEEDLSITFDLVDGIKHMGGHFDGAWNLRGNLGPYWGPQIPTQIWHHLVNDTLEKIEIFCWQNFKFWWGVKFEGRFGTLLGPPSPPQNLASISWWYPWKNWNFLLTKFQILTGREIWGVIWDPIGAPKSHPKFGISWPMIHLHFVFCSDFAPFCVSVITGSRNTRL